MSGAAVAQAPQDVQIRYNAAAACAWLWTGAPCRWHGRVKLDFRYVRFRSLQCAISAKHPGVVSAYARKIGLGLAVPPLIVSATEGGTYYVHDGNHRYEAIRSFFNCVPGAHVRVAVVLPKHGYRFQWRWFENCGTYILEPRTHSSVPTLRYRCL